MTTSIFLFALIAALAAVSQAVIPSFGQQSVAVERAKLQDSDFLIKPRLGSVVTTANFTLRVADFNKYPILAFPDVQSFVILATVNFKKSVFTHYHPRATETLTSFRGTFSVQIIFEGLGNARVVDIMVPAGQSTVFPQGLPHTTTCMTASGCVFSAIFNSADPGLIPF